MRALLLLTALLTLGVTSPASAAGRECGAVAGLDEAVVACETDETQLTETIAAAPSGTVYETRINFVSDAGAAACNNPVVCASPPGSVLYSVLRSTDGGATFEKVSEACLTNTPADAPPVITPALVAEEFTRLTWPAATLQVQPPGGRTLVNLATNLYTTDTGPQTQTVTLLGQGVEIEATPTTWTWKHGDGTTQTTNQPGRAYPDLDITHTYTAATDQPLAPSVDTTYTGRFRVNGGPWATIPTTVTVAGTPAQLQVVTARPQLVGADR